MSSWSKVPVWKTLQKARLCSKDLHSRVELTSGGGEGGLSTSRESLDIVTE